MKKPRIVRRLVTGIYPVQHRAFSPVGSRAGLERHPVFHRPARFPTDKKSRPCTAAHSKGRRKQKKDRGYETGCGLFVCHTSGKSALWSG